MNVKICGITNRSDAYAAISYGADALGFLFAKESPRFLQSEEIKKIIASLPPFVTTVGVFTEGTQKELQELVDFCGIGLIQFHGRFSREIVEGFAERAIAVVPVRTESDLLKERPLSVRAYLLDSFHEERTYGSGIPFNWEIAVKAKSWGAVILAGGLTPENVQEAVIKVRPYAVDVCSGVEEKPGKKDPTKLKRFIELAKAI